MAGIGDILGTLTSGFEASEGAIISAVASFSISEIIKLTLEEAKKISTSLQHFINNLKSGMDWGDAMSRLLTEVWNGVKSTLSDLATDFVEAVGKVFQSVGLIGATA